MRKLSILSLGLFIATSSFATENSDQLLEQEILTGKSATTEVSSNMNKDLSGATSGFGRFRFGYSAGIGYYKSASVENYPNMSGVSGEFGFYSLFNPIRDWVDVELGLRGLYVFPYDGEKQDSKTGKTRKKSYSGLASGSLYTGLVFRFPGASSAIAAGVYQDFIAKSQFSEKQEMNTNFKNSLKYKPGQGVYVEYQWDSLRDSGSLPIIPFIRITYGTYKSEYRTATETQTNREKLLGGMFGVKF